MALSRVTTWSSGQVLTASALNAEFNNLLDNANSLISPYTGNVDVNSNDQTNIDELHFVNAASSATAAGRLRRSTAANLTWHNATAAERVMTSEASATGSWTNVTFDAGNFVNNGGTSWTVASGDVTANRYLIVGKTMFWSLIIVTSTIVGTPSSLRVTIPAGKTTVGTSTIMGRQQNNGAAHATGMAIAPSGVTYVDFYNTPAAGVWAAGADNNELYYTMILDIA